MHVLYPEFPVIKISFLFTEDPCNPSRKALRIQGTESIKYAKIGFVSQWWNMCFCVISCFLFWHYPNSQYYCTVKTFLGNPWVPVTGELMLDLMEAGVFQTVLGWFMGNAQKITAAKGLRAKVITRHLLPQDINLYKDYIVHSEKKMTPSKTLVGPEKAWFKSFLISEKSLDQYSNMYFEKYSEPFLSFRRVSNTL